LFEEPVKKRDLRVGYVVVLCALSCVVSRAQTVVNTGAISGVVYDSSGATFPGAAITVRAAATQSTQTQITTREGTFLFPALPVGQYALTVKASGFRANEIQEITVRVGESLHVETRLQPGAASNSIVVTANTPLLRSTESTVSTVIDRESLNGLPLNGRRYTDFSLLTPNASPDGQSGLVSFGGEQGGEDSGYANGNGANAFTLDGANATSTYFGNARGGERVPYVFGENAIQEFQVAVSPYVSTYGGAATGFLNTVTKSGSDAFHGNVFYYNRNSGTGANSAINKEFGYPRSVDVLQQFGGSIGGPIVRERAWFFVDYEQQHEKTPILVANSDYQDVDQTAFGVPASVVLPAPSGPLPVPSAHSSPDPTNAVYLQQVSNALNAIQSNLGTHSRYRNDLAVLGKLDYQTNSRSRFYLSLNLNRFDSPNGEITSSNTALFGIGALADSYVRDYQASAGWTYTLTANAVNEFHASVSRDDQYSPAAGMVPATLPSVVLSIPTNFVLGNAGFAGGRTNEAQWELAERVQYVHRRHHFQFGVEGNHAHVADAAFGGFDPDAQKQNGSLLGTYAFSSFTNFALGIFDSFSQAAGNSTFSFDVPYIGFYAQDTYQVMPRVSLDLGVREDFQIYPQPKANPAFPLTGQFPNQYQRVAPRFGFAWQPLEKTVVRGGFGIFYENFNGLNYRNSVISNGVASQQSSVSISYDPTRAPNQQSVVFPGRLSSAQVFDGSTNTLPNISLVDPSFRDPEVLQASLQIEQEILRETILSIGTMWTHGIHLISSSAYDLNLMPPTGTTTYMVCDSGGACTGKPIVLPNLDSGLLQEGRILSQFGQINALISPGINHYNSLFVQVQRRFHSGVALQAGYTLSKNMMSNGVDFSNQFDLSNTHAPYLLDQRHRLTIAAVYEPLSGKHFESGWARALASNWAMSTVMLFSSGRPYAALLDVANGSAGSASGDVLRGFYSPRPYDSGGAVVSNSVNNSAALQATANSALGINGSGPSPVTGLNSFYGPWTQQIDLGIARLFTLGEKRSIVLQAQAFNLLNHANYYVQNGNGVDAIQYTPTGPSCGDGQTLNQNCYLIPNPDFKALQVISALNGPRVFQFSFKYVF
jgi:hypothetical protein